MAGGTFVAVLGAFVAGGAVMYAAIQMQQGTRYRPKSDTDDEEDGTNNGNSTKSQRRSPFLLRGSKSSQIALNETSMEHVNFMTDLLDRLWPHINAAGSAIIRDTVEPMFADMMPSPFKSLHFTKVDLGKVPIRLDNILVHELRDGNVQMDMDVSWQSNSDIQLQAQYVGSFGVQSIHLNGRMTFLMKPLTDMLPIVGAVQYGFINPPTLDLHFTGLASIADFSVVDKTIQSIVQEVLAGMMVLPQRMTTKMDGNVDFRELYQPPEGIVRVTCARGRGFEIEKILLGPDDIPDTYCKIQLGCEEEWITSVVEDDLNPVWNETHDFLLCDKDQIIKLEAWDEDKAPLDPDDFLGRAQVTVGEVLLAGKTLELALMDDDRKPNNAFVTLHCEVLKFTSSLESLDKADPETICGMKSIVIVQAFDLPLRRKDAASYVKVLHNEEEFVTGVVADGSGVDALNPVYDLPILIELRSKEDAKKPVQILLMNDEKILAQTEVKYDALVASKHHVVAEKRKLSNGASLVFSVSLFGVDEASALASASAQAAGSSSTRGVDLSNGDMATQEQVRVAIQKGRGFKVRKRRLKRDDIPDCYCEVRFGSSPKVWRTKTVTDSVSPKWKDEFRVFHLSNLNQIIHMDVYDENRRSKDTYLGSARITVGKVLLCGGSTEVELQVNGASTQSFIELSCEMV